ncbi:MAG: hypothetical protein MSB80_00605 [Alphaproteobacteria bacterium]|nr:hypothetical protein [Alphaproteobacteria bacterium]
MNNTITQSGRSMIEVMGYMAAVMAVIAGVSKIITGSYNQYKLSKASIQVSDLASVIVKASTVDPNYDDTVDAIKQGTNKGRRLLPSSFKMDNNKKIYHAFGGEATLGILNDKFTITFTGLTREQCIELGMKEWINNKIVDLYGIDINGNKWTWPIYADTTSGISALPTKRSALAGKDLNDEGQCNKPGKSNSIMWIFN